MKQQLEITEKIYHQVLDWYKSAENKAQIILTILSSFIVFSTGIILANPVDFQKTLDHFGTNIYLLLSLAALSILYGVYASFKCLHSRLNVGISIVDPETKTYPLSEMFFFGYHAQHNHKVLTHSLKLLTEDKQIDMYAYQITILSQNVMQKHKWVNRGFLAVSLSVFFLLLTIGFYIINLTTLV